MLLPPHPPQDRVNACPHQRRESQPENPRAFRGPYGRHLRRDRPLESPEEEQELEVREVQPYGAGPPTAGEDGVLFHLPFRLAAGHNVRDAEAAKEWGHTKHENALLM